MTTLPAPAVHAELARERKVAACLAVLDRNKNSLGVDDRDLLRFVAGFSEARWSALAAKADVPALSETSRALIVARLRGRLP